MGGWRNPGTGSTDFEWVEASGRGTVYSVTVVQQKPPARVRHDARPTGCGCGCRAAMGAVESRGVPARRVDDAAILIGAPRLRSVRGARLLPGHRWRRRHCHDTRGAGAGFRRAAVLCTERGERHLASGNLECTGSDRDRGKGVGRASLFAGGGCRKRYRCALEIYDAFTINTILSSRGFGPLPQRRRRSIRGERPNRARRGA
jgi:hypothetical protein